MAPNKNHRDPNTFDLFANVPTPSPHGDGQVGQSANADSRSLTQTSLPELSDTELTVPAQPAPPPLVSSITGERPYPVFRIDMVKDRDFHGPAISTPDDLGRLFAAYLGACPVEHFVVCLLTTHLRPTGLVTVSVGTIDMAPVWMPSVFRPAVIQGSPAIAVGHCHPSTSLVPSSADKAITRKIVEAGKLLDVRVIDHVIVGGPSSWASFAEMGLM